MSDLTGILSDFRRECSCNLGHYAGTSAVETLVRRAVELVRDDQHAENERLRAALRAIVIGGENQ